MTARGAVARTPDAVTEKPVVCAGLVVSDLFVPPLDSLPASGELVIIDAPLNDVGGCAANTASSLEHLGIPTILAAHVGDDSHGDLVREKLRRKGVDVTRVTSSPLPTSQTVILPVRGDDRRYIHAVGANASLTAEEVARVARDSSIVVVGGFLALPGLSATSLAETFAKAQERGTCTILDVVIPHGHPDAKSDLKIVLPHVDWFFPNSDEALHLTGETDPFPQADALLGWGCRNVVITRGSDGALYSDGYMTITVEPCEILAVDPSGAGDAFVAGMVVGIRENWAVEQTLRFAAALGASATRGLGCTNTLFTREEAILVAESIATITTPARAGRKDS